MSQEKSFLSFNPDLLDDEDFWPLSGLEGLCAKLGLSAVGTREELGNRLRVWHVQKYKTGGLHGGNFHLLPVKETSVAASFLSPFRRFASDAERKPILRKRSRYSGNSAASSRRSSSLSGRERRSREPSSAAGSKKAKTVQFSPYNKVHLLSPRRRSSDLSDLQGARLDFDVCAESNN